MAKQPNLPCEVLTVDPTCRVRSLEHRMVKMSIWAMPLIFVGALVGFAQFGQTILFLHPPRPFSSVMTSRLGLVAALAAMLTIPVWWLSLRITERSSRSMQTIACLCFALLSIVATNIALENPRAAWGFQEAVKARTPQLNFARNIVFMQQHLTKQDTAESASSLKIGLVGSSQINLGVDSAQLSRELNEAKVAKICLPGMVPLQYAALSRDIDAQRFDVVVCWLSEFDFFREQTLPTSRLRWCCNLANLQALLSTLSSKQIWKSRSDMADLAVATQVGIWQQRELFQMLAFRFWWRFDAETTVASKEEIQIGARLGNRQQGITNARKNIARTPLLETNFAAFRQFRKAVTASGAQLIVLEGECHPDAMAAYDKTFRLETRDRLSRWAATEGFTFVEAVDRFNIKESDWSDAVHLNETGRSKLTSFLASFIKQQTSDHISNLNLEN